jgi:isopenicillin N synthase-like dioxygenase
VAKKFSQGPNKYPEHVSNPVLFKETIDGYFNSMWALAENIVRVLCKTLNLQDDWVSEFVETPIAILRLLHYPPQPPNASELERGIGAHTDFGAVTILLQDMVGGLQVWDRQATEWVDVKPVSGALVVNLGNLMMRWTNDRYISNLHRVINKSGKERYSVPFFFSGNPDFLVECFKECQDPQLGAKHPPITVSDWIQGRYADTYSTVKGKALGELFVKEVAVGLAN